MRSKDGVHWTKPEIVLHDPVQKYSILSPCVQRMQDGTLADVVRRYRKYRVSESEATRFAPAPRRMACTGARRRPARISSQPGYQLWHLTDLARSCGLICCTRSILRTRTAQTATTASCFTRSSRRASRGKRFQKPLMEQGRDGSWDDFCLYRTAFLLDREADVLRVWYGGKKKSDASWGIGYTEGQYSQICAALER